MLSRLADSTYFSWLDILSFSLALWLGAYLLKRNIQHMRICLTGLSLLFYSCAEGCLVLGSTATSFSIPLLEASQWLIVGSASLWMGGLLFCLPENLKLRSWLVRTWLFVLLPLGIFCCVIALWLPSSLPLALPFLLFLPLLGLSWPALKTRRGPLMTASLLIPGTISIALFWFPYAPVRLLICSSLFLAGLTIALLDATEQGEALMPDLLRSFDYAMLTALGFGGQMVLVILFATGITFTTLLLLLSTLTTAILLQVFSSTFVRLLDALAFATFPQLRQARNELHTAIEVLPRLQTELDLETLDEAEFTRLTRRALSNLGDLSRLASNPLTHLPALKARLQTRGTKNNDVLATATELKAMLTESIDRLKPRDKGEFGSSDEWRYYNALYFPYVRGMKPYSRRFQSIYAEAPMNQALDWFRTQVPERTLHNWQNTAARLVAQDLRCQKSSDLASIATR
ncbi:MAG TPA: hypothetical protein VFN35_20335 [Ktedonobacteraceae bacterium]|nr:hypothetical protein [Ktedonobacteraceae bacterium]